MPLFAFKAKAAFRLLVLGLVWLFLFSSTQSHAYPQYFDEGTESCLHCHSNGLGGGRSLDPLSGSRQLVVPVFKLRRAYVERNPNGSDNQANWVNMQLDLGAQIEDPNKNWLFFYVYGHQPTIKNQGTNQITFQSRLAWMRIKISELDYLYFGFLEKVFGIRSADHTSLARQAVGFAASPVNGLGIAPGAIWHRTAEQMDFALNFFSKNDSEPETLAASGSSGLLEFTVFDRLRLGVSALDQKNDIKKNSIQAFHIRCCTKSPIKWLSEYGNTSETINYTDTTQRGQYFSNQLWWIAEQAFHPTLSYEWAKTETLINSTKWSLGAQWNFQENFEIRLLAQRLDSESRTTWWTMGGFLIHF